LKTKAEEPTFIKDYGIPGYPCEKCYEPTKSLVIWKGTGRKTRIAAITHTCISPYCSRFEKTVTWDMEYLSK